MLLLRGKGTFCMRCFRTAYSKKRKGYAVVNLIMASGSLASIELLAAFSLSLSVSTTLQLSVPGVFVSCESLEKREELCFFHINLIHFSL